MSRKKYTPVLTIAGSDPSGGAGIQADLKTIASTGCYGMSVITSLTVQNTQGVLSAVNVEPQLVKAQLEAVLDDITPAAIKIGMVGSAENASVIADTLRLKAGDIPLVVDPVMVSTSGHSLLEPEAEKVIVDKLLPMATVITPNFRELKALTGSLPAESTTAERVAYLATKGAQAILVTGGDNDNQGYSTDLLYMPAVSKDIIELKADRVKTVNTHGTGCTLSSAIASFLALGFPPIDAVKAAKSYITRALIAGADITLGHGHGPVNHSFGPRRTRLR